MPAQVTASSQVDPADWNRTPVDELANVAAVEAALDGVTLANARVECKLDSLLASAASAASSRATCLSAIAQTAAVASDDAGELTSLLDVSARSAQSLSTRIKFLDQVAAVSTSALTRVEHVLTLRVCAEGAKTSLSAGDLPTAAAHVHRYLTLDADVRKDPSSLAAVSQMNQSMKELARKVRERTDLVSSGDDSSGSMPTIPSVIGAVKLFVPIGLAEEGLDRFSSFLLSLITRETDADIRSLLMDTSLGEGDGADQPQPHTAALAQVFETMAAYIHDSGDSVLHIFGPFAYVTLVINLQKHCDLQSDKILVRYIEARSMDQVTRAIRSETASARHLDPLLNELSLISQRIAAYFDFLRRRCHDAFSKQVADRSPRDTPVDYSSRPAQGSSALGLPLEEEPVSSKRMVCLDKLEECLESSKLMSWTSKLSSHYTNLEAYFMRENVRKAIRIDERHDETAKTSTAVDDFFFVLQKVVNRSVTYGGSVVALVAMLHHTNECISGDLLVYVRRRLRETENAMERMMNLTASSSSMPSAALTVSYLTEFAKANMSSSTGVDGDQGNHEEGDYDFFVAVNNASVSGDYAMRFRATVEQLAVKHFAETNLADQALLTGPLQQMGELARLLTAAGQQGVSRLSTVLTARIESSTEALLLRTSYMVPDAAYNVDSAAASFSQAFLDEVEAKVLHPTVEERLTEGNWDALVRHSSEWAASAVEANVFLPSKDKADMAGKKFNPLGGIRVDRDVRSMSAYFAAKCRGTSVRDVFARLSQIAMLVNLEHPTEVYDIWGGNAGGMTWRLAPAEVRMALRLRTDFQDDVIKSLRL